MREKRNMENITWKEAAKKWVDGSTLWSVSLGGIGPGYEQAIQILVWETIARWGNREFDAVRDAGKCYPVNYSNHFESVVPALEKDCGGFSGMQVGAAKSFAYRIMKNGYAEELGRPDYQKDNRLIQVSKNYPRVQ